MNKSASITKLADALSKAQAEMPVVKMNAVNPFLKNKFADLGAVIDASRPTLAKFGLSLSQLPTSDGEKIGITNILMHTSGEWIEDTVLLSVADEKGKSAAQVAGSVITYLRRYSWASMLGLYADEDTDGHPNSDARKTEKPKQKEDSKSGVAINTIVWTVAQKQALIDGGLAKDDFAAKGMLGYSNLPADAAHSEIISWGKSYRERRTAVNPETGKAFTASEAAAFANQAVGVSA
jgi:hypothetical protein